MQPTNSSLMPCHQVNHKPIQTQGQVASTPEFELVADWLGGMASSFNMMAASSICEVLIN
jgi:hypothetical protein